jgi:RNA polymerase sigma-70 factor, ECF subfamily
VSTAGTEPTTAPPGDPVRAALDDPLVQRELMAHALARLGKLLIDRPRTARQHMAEEATQEAMKRALARKDTYDPTRATPAGWVHGILDLVLTEHCRALSKRPVQPAADPAGWDGVIARFVHDSGLDELLAALSDEHRRLVSMHYLDQMSHTEIATVLGISPGASRTRLNRAMCALRSLAEKGGGR